MTLPSQHSERPILGTVCEVCGTLWPDDADDMPDFEPCYCDLSPTPPKSGNRESLSQARAMGRERSS